MLLSSEHDLPPTFKSSFFEIHCVERMSDPFGCIRGHEDLDQIFSVQASLISRHVFDNPTELIEILDSAGRPQDEGERIRKRRKVSQIDCRAYKLDEAADWKAWVAMLGVRVKGLRHLDLSLQKLDGHFLLKIFYYMEISGVQSADIFFAEDVLARSEFT